VDLDTSSILLDTPFCIQRLYRLGLNSLENVYTLWGCEFLKERLLCIPIPSLFLRLDNEKFERLSKPRDRHCEHVSLLIAVLNMLRTGSHAHRSFLKLRPTRDVIGSSLFTLPQHHRASPAATSQDPERWTTQMSLLSTNVRINIIFQYTCTDQQ
jgi:hypothetical protein